MTEFKTPIFVVGGLVSTAATTAGGTGNGVAMGYHPEASWLAGFDALSLIASEQFVDHILVSNEMR